MKDDYEVVHLRFFHLDVPTVEMSLFHDGIFLVVSKNSMIQLEEIDVIETSPEDENQDLCISTFSHHP